MFKSKLFLDFLIDQIEIILYFDEKLLFKE